jgi:hypothetical protein
VTRGPRRFIAAAIIALSLVIAETAGAQVVAHRGAPSRCPSTSSMTRASGTKMVSLRTSRTRHSLSCSYFNAAGNVFLNYVIENSFGETSSGFWAGMRSSAHGAHAKLHKFKAGKAAAWYTDSRAGVYAEVLIGKQELSIEDRGQSGSTVARIAQAFI